MTYDSFDDFQYNSCVSRGICSISPRTSALQTVLVLYLRLFARFAYEIEVKKETQSYILNILALSIFNPEFSEESFITLSTHLKKELAKIMIEFLEKHPENTLDNEKKKAMEIFNSTEDITDAIKYGEKMFRRALDEIPSEIRDLYNILLVIAKSITINLLELESYNHEYENGFNTILNILSLINIDERNIDILKLEIQKIAEFDNKLMSYIHHVQEERYGIQGSSDVTYSTVPNKAVLVVGSNIKELEDILENLKNQNIDVYTHDDMMLAYTFPKFREYKNLKGQFGQGVENCLLDFATFPGPILLTKHSLHNIENFYRGRLFTTDIASIKGVIKIENNDYSQIIKSAYASKGFKTGKQCETVNIGYDFNETISKIKNKISELNIKHLFFIGIDGHSLEQRIYFEKLIRLVPKDTLIISFSYNYEKENLIFINSCYDFYSISRIYNEFLNVEMAKTIFIPNCERRSISQMIYFASQKNTQVFVGKCTPVILNPSLMNTLENIFEIRGISSSKKDLEIIFEDK